MSAVAVESPVALDDSQSAFINGPVSISVASRDSNLVPSLARAYGCRLNGGRREVTIFLPIARSTTVVGDLRAGAPVSVVFSRPSTHRTLQLKAPRAQVAPLAMGDREILLSYAECFGGEIRSLGYPETFVRAMVAPAAEDAVAVTFSPEAVFEQTPGPGAGRRLDHQT